MPTIEYSLSQFFVASTTVLGPEDCVVEQNTHKISGLVELMCKHQVSPLDIITKHFVCAKYCASPWAYNTEYKKKKTEYDTFPAST